MKFIAIILLTISGLAFVASTKAVFFDAHNKPHEFSTLIISEAVGAYLIPMILLIGGLLLLERSKAKTDNSPNKKGTSKKCIIAFFVIVAFCVLSVIAFISIGLISTPTYYIEIVNDCKEINKKCPYMTDQYTRLDSCISDDGRSIVYSYTLMNLKITDKNKKQICNSMKEYITNKIKNTPETKKLLEQGINMGYRYCDVDGNLLLEFDVK